MKSTPWLIVSSVLGKGHDLPRAERLRRKRLVSLARQIVNSFQGPGEALLGLGRFIATMKNIW
ncbi:TPA: hypothetical protein ACRMS5_006121, partial [Pseudomonas aeruginosa]